MYPLFTFWIRKHSLIPAMVKEVVDNVKERAENAIDAVKEKLKEFNRDPALEGVAAVRTVWTGRPPGEEPAG